SNAPRFIAWMASSAVPWPVTRRTGMRASICLTRSNASSPEESGRLTSRTTTSGFCSAIRASPSAAVRAVRVSYSGGWNALRKACRITGSSSIKRSVVIASGPWFPAGPALRAVGEADDERGTAAGPVEPAHGPPVIFHDPLRDDQPQAQPGLLAGGERLEQ